jgi:hypothetical protein
MEMRVTKLSCPEVGPIVPAGISTLRLRLGITTQNAFTSISEARIKQAKMLQLVNGYVE